MNQRAYEACALCPRACGIDRISGARGFCGSGSLPKLARAALHMWEEPCISGKNGSGAVFFSGCTLRCCFCQNQKISTGHFGKEVSVARLAEIFLSLQEQGAHNLNLVTATQYIPSVIAALDLVKPQLHIPVVWNCGGYEREESIDALAPYVDIWLPDLKYMDAKLAGNYSAAPNYFSFASKAIKRMIAHAGAPVFFSEDNGAEKTLEAHIEGGSLLKKGVIIRHMVLPQQRADSIALLHWMKEELPAHSFLISLLSQYTPYQKHERYKELNRRVTSYEYQKVVDAALLLGLSEGYMQKRSSAKEEYTPPFKLQGI